MIMKRHSIAVVMTVALAAFCIISCSIAEVSQPFRKKDGTVDLSRITVSEDRLGLFADLSDYNRVGNPGTRSPSGETYRLSDLVDESMTKTTESGGMTFKQVPFRQNEEGLLASIHKGTAITIDSCSVVKKYLIIATGEDGNTTMYVVALVAEAGDAHSGSCDFLNKPNFSGICLFSTLSGDHAVLKRYISGLVCRTVLLDSDSETNEDTEYLSLISPAQTRCWELDCPGSICIAYRNYELDPSYCIGSSPGGNNEGANSGTSNGTGGNYRQDRDINDDERLYPKADEFTVNLMTNADEIVTFNCNGHAYTEGSFIFVFPEYEIPYNPLFSSWAGDFSDMKDDSFSLTVMRDYSSIAYYDIATPCIDKEKGKCNPLANMSLAPPGPSNYFGATFGMTWNNGTKKHQGMDFAADIGTPVFSMYAGEVVYIRDDCPDEDSEGSFGNVILIKSTVNGATITIQYAHLQYGSPAAHNPITRTTLKKGDMVYQGQLIGYTGKTGNAFYVPNKHLHLGVKDSKNIWIDPGPYINGNVNAEKQNSTLKGKIENIKCD